MSWQARVLKGALRSTLRRMIAGFSDPRRARQRLDWLMRRTQNAPPLTLQLPATVGGVTGLWVSNQPVVDGVMLYFHGGAYIIGTPETHAPLLAELAARTGMRAFLPRYRLAPENPFPAAFDDALATWEGLLALGHDPAHIVLGGDSAGGGLALALLGHLCRTGQRPAGLFAFSPWTDLTFSGASLVTNASRDQILPAHRLTEVRGYILGGARPQDADDPRLSPVHAQFPGAPPVQLHAAETEVLRDDTLRMRGRLPEAEIRIAGDLPHVWPLFSRVLPEARATLAQTAGFIRSCLPD